MSDLHFSRLKWMSRSAAHFLHAQDEQTAARRGGTLVHALTLGGDLIVYDGERTGNAWKHFKALVAGEPFVVFNEPRRGKLWEAAKEAAGDTLIVSDADLACAREPRARQLQAEAEGRRPLTIVTQEEYDDARRCADAVLRHPIAAPLLQDAQTEVPLRWEYLGRACAGTLDVLGSGRLCEVKTTAIASPGFITHQSLKYHYLAQMAWYREGARLNGHRVQASFIIGVETREPFPVTVMQPTERALEMGERTVRLWMERLLACEAANVFPEYAQDVVELDVPEDPDLDFGETEEAA